MCNAIASFDGANEVHFKYKMDGSERILMGNGLHLLLRQHYRIASAFLEVCANSAETDVMRPN